MMIQISTYNEKKILGKDVKRNFEEMVEANWARVINNISKNIVSNNIRNLDIIRKIWYTNIYLLSKIWYTAQILPQPHKFAQKIDEIKGSYICKGCLYRGEAHGRH